MSNSKCLWRRDWSPESRFRNEGKVEFWEGKVVGIMACLRKTEGSGSALEFRGRQDFERKGRRLGGSVWLGWA